MKISMFSDKRAFAMLLLLAAPLTFGFQSGSGPLNAHDVFRVKYVPNDDPRQSFVFKLDKMLDSFQEISPFVRKTKDNLFLQGNYAPVAAEHRAVSLVEVVEGFIPSDLDGIFMRNGPNPLPGQTSKPYHWFDGHGMIHSIRIKNGKASYTNNFIPTPR
jgi:Retinal pigment epithelial membrane protein